MDEPKQYHRWLWRCGLSLILMAAGWWLWQAKASASSAPVVVKGLVPLAVAVDTAGNLYVADKKNYCVWKVNGRRVERVAGTGKRGFGGDGGKAVRASLARPHDLAVDSKGNLYIADSDFIENHGNACIRKVNKAGIITTVAGRIGEKDDQKEGGRIVILSFPLSIALDGKDNLYAADGDYSFVCKVGKGNNLTIVAGGGESGYSGDGGKAVKAGLDSPEG